MVRLYAIKRLAKLLLNERRRSPILETLTQVEGIFGNMSGGGGEDGPAFEWMRSGSDRMRLTQV